MLVGAHVSPAGGLVNAIVRGEERECRAIQVFHQSPRAWRPAKYTDDDFAAFRKALTPSPIDAVLIHAVYLINCASEDADLREKSLGSLTHALRVGAGIGSAGVVLHAGSAKGTPVDAAITRAGSLIAEALAEAEKCPLHLENTAGSGGTLGRSFEELQALIDAAGGDGRLGVCLDSCHLLASGYDIRSARGLSQALGEFDRLVGLDRLSSLHVNDSRTPLGSNSDRHAPLGDGELGNRGCAAFLSEPRFEGLPAVFEGPGIEGKAPSRRDVHRMLQLRERGLAARSRSARSGGRTPAAPRPRRRSSRRSAG
jgi:deoxyribonuclease IV